MAGSIPGPMGAVLTPSLIGVDKAGHLPNASTFCGRCESVCPVRIPLPKLMRHWREREFERHLSPGDRALGPRLLGASSPSGRRSTGCATGIAMQGAGLVRAATRAASRPCRCAGGWTRLPRLPAPAGRHLPEPVEAAQGQLASELQDAAPATTSSARSAARSASPAAKRRAASAGSRTASPARRAGVMPERGQLDARRAARAVQGAGRGDARHRRRGGGCLRRARRGRRLSAPRQPAGAAAHGRRSAPRRHAVGRDGAGGHAPAAATGGDLVAVNHAFGGVAETGTLALVSGPDNPTTLNFLPDYAIARRLRRSDIDGRLRERVGPPARPLRQGRHAAHGELGHRPVALRRHRADAAARRPWPAQRAHRHRQGLSLTGVMLRCPCPTA